MVEEAPGDLKPDRYREEEKNDGRAGDHSVGYVDHIERSEFPAGLNNFEGEGVDQRVERGLEKIGKLFGGDRFAREFKLANGKRAEVFCGKPFTGRERSGDLGLVHGGRGGETTKLDEEIEERDGRHESGKG